MILKISKNISFDLSFNLKPMYVLDQKDTKRYVFVGFSKNHKKQHNLISVVFWPFVFSFLKKN